jgi:alpha-tubulin suppressor-like RCC1 family protein
VVRIGGEAVTEYTRWTDTEVQLRIPRTVVPGTVRAVVTVGARETALPVRIGKAMPIAAGNLGSLVLRTEGQVVAWGESFEGQTHVPVDLKEVVRVDAGSTFGLALTSGGTVVAWGDRNLPRRGTAVPTGLSEVVAVAAGSGHGLALKADGTVVAWGDNTYGQATVAPGLTAFQP